MATPEVTQETTAPEAQAQAQGQSTLSAQNIPIVQQVASGDLFGVAFPKGLKTPAIEVLKKDLKALQEMGLGFYRPDSKGIDAVMFNEAKITPQQLEALDKAGMLKEFFPPFLPESDPFLQAARGGDTRSVSPSVAPTARAKTQPAKAQARMTSARNANLTPEEPSDTARPGAGQLLNQLGKRAV